MSAVKMALNCSPFEILWTVCNQTLGQNFRVFPLD